MIPHHELDEAITALEHFNEGVQNKINQPLPHQVEIDQREEIKEQLKSLRMVPAWFAGDIESLSVHGAIAQCCDSQLFRVFQLDHHDHLHLQCSHCGTSYCPVGKCKL